MKEIDLLHTVGTERIGKEEAKLALYQACKYFTGPVDKSVLHWAQITGNDEIFTYLWDPCGSAKHDFHFSGSWTEEQR